VSAGEPAAWQGQSLAAYLDMLNDQGVRVIYTSDLVTADLRLAEEPDSGDPAGGLAEVLRPFGLTARAGPAGSLLVVRLEAPAEEPRTAPGTLPKEVAIPEIVVSSSLHRLDYATPATHTYLDRELATRIPTTADEAVRLTNRLPGTASGGISTRTHIRGGEVNEVLFLFDGLRLYEPYHLKDFQTVATIVNSNAIGGMEFYAGAYPAHYGDRMSGVLSIDMREPEKPIETELALSFFNASVLSLGTFGGDRQGDWLLTARRGNLDLVVDVIDPEAGRPDYQDYLGHVGWQFGPRADISANVLTSEDTIRLANVGRGEEAGASYTNQVFWLKWRAEWSEALDSDSILAFSDVTDLRAGSLNLPGIVSGNVDEYREFRVVELRQDWRWVAAPDWMLRFGFDIKQLDARYRFTSDKTVEPPFDTILDNQPSTLRDYALSPSGGQYAAYSELRWRPLPRVTFDLGLRWDQQHYTTSDDDEQLSPRASLLYTPQERTELRIGWGRYYQAQEINELQVSDGISTFFPAQAADHFVINAKHHFLPGVDLDLSLYRKHFGTLRPRFENSFNTLTLLPELQFDRVRVDANSARAIGAEMTLSRGSSAAKLLWWVSYAWSEVVDSTRDGNIARSWNQTHSVKGGLSWRWGPWDFSAVGEVHSGWPATELTGALTERPDGSTELDLAVTARNALRYAPFDALDVRVSRNFDLSRGELVTFLEVSNAYDRVNPCCIQYSLLPDGSLGGEVGNWLPIVPSLGVIWRF